MTRAMYMSKLYAPTLKEDPADAELASHRLLLRAGMIRKEAAGLYSYLPLAWRSIRKIENIVRDEMDAAGAQELMMPIMVDAELWRESGRIDAYGKELVRFDDRHGREFVLGPTHEETVTALVRNELRSYKQLPVNLYHIQDKFRDEFRPRFGLMRGREFIMKDAYSFTLDKEGLVKAYMDERGAYERIFNRLDLKYVPVHAMAGPMGGFESEEFLAPMEIGEDTFTRFYYGYMDAILREDWPEATALCDSLLISLRWVKEFALHNPIIMVIIVTVALIGILYWFFGTELGCAIRATGSNPAMSRAQGINTNFNIVLGLAVSNGLVALSGALLSQYQGFADVGMGRGAIVIGLAAVIIGEALFSRIFHNFALKLVSVSLGAIIYYIVIQLVLTLGFDANLLKLLSASVVAVFLAVPYWKSKYFAKPAAKKAQKEDAKNA